MRDTRAHAGTDHTDEPHNHPPKPKDTNPHENRDQLNSRKNSRKPGVDRRTAPSTVQYGYQYRYPNRFELCPGAAPPVSFYRLGLACFNPTNTFSLT